MVGAKLYRGSGDRSVTENNFHKYRIMYLKSAGLIVIDLIDLGNVIRRVLVAFSLSLPSFCLQPSFIALVHPTS